MKIRELFMKKPGPYPMPEKGSRTSKGDILAFIKDLKSLGMSKGDILKQVKDKHGSDYLQVAEQMMEATHHAPLTGEQREGLRELLDTEDCHVSVEDVNKYIVDDALNQELEMADPTSVKPIVVKWLELNMPDFFRSEGELMGDGNGIFSPVHGYTETELEGSTGNF